MALALDVPPAIVIDDVIAIAAQGRNGKWAMREDFYGRVVRISRGSPLLFDSLDELVAEINRALPQEF